MTTGEIISKNIAGSKKYNVEPNPIKRSSYDNTAFQLFRLFFKKQCLHVATYKKMLQAQNAVTLYFVAIFCSLNKSIFCLVSWNKKLKLVWGNIPWQYSKVTVFSWNVIFRIRLVSKAFFFRK